MREDEVVSMLVDMETLRPACVLIQALGARGNYRPLLMEFSDLWITHPTPGMALATEPLWKFRKAFELAKERKEKK